MSYPEAMPAGDHRRLMGVLIAVAAGCGATPTEAPLLPPGSTPVASAETPERAPAGPEVQSPGAKAAPAPEAPPALPAPIETRVSGATLAVYDATERTREHLRGQIPRGAPFRVYDIIEGPNCHGGEWGQPA